MQYAPELLPALKRRVDRTQEKGLYVISGSQNLAVLRQITESLAGRVAIIELPPMCRRELDGGAVDRPSSWRAGLPPEVSMYQAIWRGGYPGLLELPDDLVQPHHRSYMQTYIERDVRVLAGVAIYS